jgi:predicted lipoprotein with Yx(FWY)xxD motif
LCGAVGAGLLVATGAIHLDLYLTGYRSIPTIGWLFLFQVIAAFALAAAVLATSVLPRASFAAALAAASGALFAVATLGGYLLSLRVGLFGFREVRTTAGIVAGVIEVAAFATLAVAALPAVTLIIPAVARRALPAVALVSVVALVLLGATVSAGQGAAGQGGSGQSPGTAGQVLGTDRINGVNVLTNSKGLTLYWFAPDSSSASRCTGSCAAYWPPVFGKATAGAGVTGTLGTITRPDGTTQATYDGHPLYTYVGDSGPGQASGNNLDLNGGLWHEVGV